MAEPLDFFAAVAELFDLESLDVPALHPEVQRLLRQNGREETVHSERAARVLAILRAR